MRQSQGKQEINVEDFPSKCIKKSKEREKKNKKIKKKVGQAILEDQQLTFRNSRKETGRNYQQTVPQKVQKLQNNFLNNFLNYKCLHSDHKQHCIRQYNYEIS